MSVIATSSDNTLIFYGVSNTESDLSESLNIPDAKKLLRAIKFTTEDEITFKLSSNALKYAGSGVKFKYHLYEDDFLKRPKIKPEKIEAFQYDIDFQLTRAHIQAIVKGSAFASETSKLYFYTEDGKLIAELGDKMKTNTDNFSIELCDVDFNIAPLIMKLENLQNVELLGSEVAVNINTTLGVICFTVENIEKGIKLRYIVTCLKQ